MMNYTREIRRIDGIKTEVEIEVLGYPSHETVLKYFASSFASTYSFISSPSSWQVNCASNYHYYSLIFTITYIIIINETIFILFVSSPASRIQWCSLERALIRLGELTSPGQNFNSSEYINYSSSISLFPLFISRNITLL